MHHTLSHPLRLISALLFFTLVAGCSSNEDDAKYQSTPPTFSDLTLVNASGGDALRAGEVCKATAVQASKGRLLNATEYTWQASPDADVYIDKAQYGVIYDNESANPTASFTFPRAGHYIITLKARYSISGTAGAYNGTTRPAPGVEVKVSTPSFQFYDIEVKRTVVVAAN